MLTLDFLFYIILECFGGAAVMVELHQTVNLAL